MNCYISEAGKKTVQPSPEKPKCLTLEKWIARQCMKHFYIYFTTYKQKASLILNYVFCQKNQHLKQVQKSHISKHFKVRSTGSQSLFGNRVVFVTPELFHCTSGSNPKLLNYDHKPHMITTHLGDYVITRVYFLNKVHGYWKGHKCPLYFISMSFSCLTSYIWRYHTRM